MSHKCFVMERSKKEATLKSYPVPYVKCKKLVLALMSGNLDFVREQIPKKVHVNQIMEPYPGRALSYPVFIAVEYDSSAVILDYILRQGADALLRDHMGYSVFMKAASLPYVNKKTVDALFGKWGDAGEMLNDQHSSGNTPVHMAVASNNVYLLDKLLSSSNLVRVSTIKNRKGDTALTLAIKCNRGPVMTSMLVAHAKETKESLITTDGNGYTALELATLFEMTALVHELTRKGNYCCSCNCHQQAEVKATLSDARSEELLLSETDSLDCDSNSLTLEKELDERGEEKELDERGEELERENNKLNDDLTLFKTQNKMLQDTAKTREVEIDRLSREVSAASDKRTIEATTFSKKEAALEDLVKRQLNDIRRLEEHTETTSSLLKASESKRVLAEDALAKERSKVSNLTADLGDLELNTIPELQRVKSSYEAVKSALSKMEVRAVKADEDAKVLFEENTHLRDEADKLRVHLDETVKLSQNIESDRQETLLCLDEERTQMSNLWRMIREQRGEMDKEVSSILDTVMHSADQLTYQLSMEITQRGRGAQQRYEAFDMSIKDFIDSIQALRIPNIEKTK